jgi:hypothetical protein
LTITTRVEQIQRVDADSIRDPLEALERQVPLAALNPAHVRAVHAEEVGEGFLT